MSDAQALMKSYPQGREIMVWVHRQKPWIATLEARLQWQDVWLLIPPSLMLCGLWMAWKGLGRVNPPRRGA